MIHARYTPLNLYLEFDKSNNIKQKKHLSKENYQFLYYYYTKS